jgi:sigma-B regulation protein RsbU (phosphoserine phosphatase)
MSGMDGYEVCERLKAEARTHDIPIIFISALSETQDKVKAFAAGGVDYVTKPFQIDEVLARVETHLTLRDLQKQLQEANRRFERELMLAGQIQSSFWSNTLPNVPGWQMSVTLKPVRETSGDFYDVSLLSNGQLSIVVADVVDKGAGAALYMALCCTLIRTYAAEYPSEPERVLSKTNRRILADTDAGQFVTAFYGILDPLTGTLTFCNAGHNPPYVVGAQHGDGVQRLVRTGMPLGIYEHETWERGVVQIAPGAVLVMYTDGITDAQNTQAVFFDETRLLESIKQNLGHSARDIRDALMTRILDFMGDAPQLDDIALVVVAREPEVESVSPNGHFDT